MYGFGDGTVAPLGSIHGSIPKNVLTTILHKGKDQASHLCLGTSGRGGKRYMPWEEDVNKVDLNNNKDFVPLPDELRPFLEQGILPPIILWKNKSLVTIPCSDSDAVIEFVFVPFIIEDQGNEFHHPPPTQAPEESMISNQDRQEL
jgi:hypothetical protein